MNRSEWSYSLYPSYYSYPCNTSLNSSSSGYESASNDSSITDPYLTNPLSIVKKEQVNVIKDDQIDMTEESIDYDTHYRSKKRRILSHSQREEANRRERHRMELINQAYERLRHRLPFKNGRKRQKMSRMDTIDGAIRYIQSLLEILDGQNSHSDFVKI